MFFLQIKDNSCSDKQLWIQSTSCILFYWNCFFGTGHVAFPELQMPFVMSFSCFSVYNIWVHKIYTGKEKLSCKKIHKKWWGKIYILFLAAQFPVMSVFVTFFVSSPPPFKVTFTYASLKNDFSWCQLNPVPTIVLFFKKMIFIF